MGITFRRISPSAGAGATSAAPSGSICAAGSVIAEPRSSGANSKANSSKSTERRSEACEDAGVSLSVGHHRSAGEARPDQRKRTRSEIRLGRDRDVVVEVGVVLGAHLFEDRDLHAPIALD